METEQNGCFLTDRKCPVCGKTFVPFRVEMWTYRKGNIYLCSWSCLQKWRNEGYSKYDYTQPGYGKKKDTKETRMILKMLKDGKHPEEIAKKMGVSQQLVYYYRRTRLKNNENEDE